MLLLFLGGSRGEKVVRDAIFTNSCLTKIINRGDIQYTTESEVWYGWTPKNIQKKNTKHLRRSDWMSREYDHTCCYYHVLVCYWFTWITAVKSHLPAEVPPWVCTVFVQRRIGSSFVRRTRWGGFGIDYNDVSRGHPKWWFNKGTSPKSP